MDPSISAAITASIESIINSALGYDPASMQKIAAISDVLAIQSTRPALTLYCHGSNDGVRIMSHCESPVTTQLSGTPLALISLLKKPTTLANSGVELTGSVGLLQHWQAILNELDIDWEDAISTVLGDLAGPITAKTISGGISWTKHQSAEQTQLFKEYITEELKVTPSKPELNIFSNAVSELKMDAERLQARFTQLLETHTINTSKSDKNNKKDNNE
jgi:ubiquinone biosynthesis protein UbiJ